MGDAQPGALLAAGNRDSFKMEDRPQPVAMGDLNPNYTGLLFPDTELEKPDLSSLVEDLPEEVRRRILLTVEESHQENLRRVQVLDQRFRSLYTSATGLVNDAMETYRAFGKVTAALDIRQQLIVRKSGPFVRKATPPSGVGKRLKPGAKPVPAAAVSSAQGAQKKKRSQGKGRKIQGLPPHPNPPPAPAPASDQRKTVSAS